MVLHAESLHTALRNRMPMRHLVAGRLCRLPLHARASPMHAETGMSNSDNALPLWRARRRPDGLDQF